MSSESKQIIVLGAEVNGRPALVVRDGQERPAFVVTIETGGGKIQKIWAMANPDKLRGVA